MIDRLERDQEAPPHDWLAEAIVLRGLLLKPHLIATYDPMLLLVWPEHRLALACMKRAYVATAGQSWGHFYCEWVAECDREQGERKHPDEPRLYELLDEIDEDQAILFDGTPWNGRDWLWWWNWLKKLTEARRLVSLAQDMAASAWRGDVEAARQIAAKASPRAPSAGISVWERDAL